MTRDTTRRQALARTHVLDTPTDEFFDRIKHTVALGLKCSVVFVGVWDETGVRLKSWLGFNPCQAQEDALLHIVTRHSSGSVAIRDIASVGTLGSLADGNMLRSLAAASLTTKDGAVVGAIAVLDTRPRRFTKADQSLLASFAAIIAAEIEVVPTSQATAVLDSAIAASPSVPDGIPSSPEISLGIHTVAGRCEYISDNCAAVSGYTPEEMKALDPFQSFVHPDDAERIRAEGYLPVLEGSTCSTVYRGRRKDGVYRWFETLSAPMYGKDKTFTGIMTCTKDVTSRQLVEQQLLESQKRFRSLFDYCLDAVLCLDMDGRIESVNRACHQLLGYSTDDLRERSFTSLVSPGDRGMIGAIFELTRQGEPLTFDVLLVDHGKRKIPCSGLSVPTVVDGKVVGVYLIAHDSTVQKRVEALIREENEVLGLIAARVPLAHILAEITRSVDALCDGAMSAVMLSDSERGEMRFGAGSSVPEILRNGLRDLVLKQTGAPCWIAASRRERVTFDINDRALDDGVREAMLTEKVRTIWSAPIVSSRNLVLGTLDIYFSKPRSLRPEDVQIVNRAVHLARIATEREMDDRAIVESESRFRQLTEKSSDIILILGLDRLIRYASPSAERILGFATQSIINGDPLQMIHAEDLSTVQGAFLDLLSRPGETISASFRIRHKDGSWRDIESVATNLIETPGIRGIVVNARDVTERKKAEEQLDYMAYHDVLCDLPNRLLFNKNLYRAIEDARRDGRLVGVLFLDLDRFKVINDTLGHSVGDVLLRSVAQRLKLALRKDDTVARWGGDEFTFILPNLSRTMEAIRTAERIVNALAEPFLIQGNELYMTAAIGIGIYPAAGDDVVTLMRNADIAMFHAKEHGTNYYLLYTPAMSEGASERLVIEGGLRKALEREEFMLMYQPQVDVFTGRVIGLEALIRWKHPEFGLIPPSDFISLLEETGMIVPVGEWVIRTACNQARIWRDLGCWPLRVSINMSARQLRDRSLVPAVRAALAESQLDADSLEMELTESILVDNSKQSMRALAELREMGIHIAIDDFGTGYSSFMYLKKYPIDTLKIDRSFVRNLGSDNSDTAISQSIIQMARSLNLRAIAEGVETLEQYQILVEQGCEVMQGFYFNPPLTVDAATAVVEKSLSRNQIRLSA